MSSQNQEQEMTEQELDELFGFFVDIPGDETVERKEEEPESSSSFAGNLRSNNDQGSSNDGASSSFFEPDSQIPPHSLSGDLRTQYHLPEDLPQNPPQLEMAVHQQDNTNMPNIFVSIGEILNDRGVPTWPTFPLDANIADPPPNHVAYLMATGYSIEVNGQKVLRLEDNCYGTAIWLGVKFYEMAQRVLQQEPQFPLILHSATIYHERRRMTQHAAATQRMEEQRMAGEVAFMEEIRRRGKGTMPQL